MSNYGPREPVGFREFYLEYAGAIQAGMGDKLFNEPFRAEYSPLSIVQTAYEFGRAWIAAGGPVQIIQRKGKRGRKTVTPKAASLARTHGSDLYPRRKKA